MNLHNDPVLPSSSSATRQRSLSDKLYALWVALALASVVAAGFAISSLAYPYLVTNAPSGSVETVGETISEIWDGSVP